jgi:hypothetical protein
MRRRVSAPIRIMLASSVNETVRIGVGHHPPLFAEYPQLRAIPSARKAASTIVSVPQSQRTRQRERPGPGTRPETISRPMRRPARTARRFLIGRASPSNNSPLTNLIFLI